MNKVQRRSAQLALHFLSFMTGWLFYGFQYQLEAQAPTVYLALGAIVLLNWWATNTFAEQGVPQ